MNSSIKDIGCFACYSCTLAVFASDKLGRGIACMSIEVILN